MNFNLCPTCLADNTDDARHCHRCGQVLADDTVPLPLAERDTQFLPGGLWLDDLQPTAPTAPPGAPLTITLRNLKPPDPPPPAPPPPIETVETDAPRLPDLPTLDDVATVPDALAAQAWPPLPRPVDTSDLPTLRTLPELHDELPPPAAAPAPVAPDLDAKRAARRASVRRSRLRALARELPAGGVPEVLVVDRNDIERGILCGLLQAFGFGTHSVADAAQALPLLEQHAFTAVFADIAFDAGDGGAGIALARRLRAREPRPLFVLVTAPLSSIDRVRAELTGCDDIVFKRVTRGSVAGVLDGHGIPLPMDARRS